MVIYKYITIGYPSYEMAQLNNNGETFVCSVAITIPQSA